jgi:hypothetical protein
MIGVFHMSAVIRFFGAWLCLNPRKARRLAANTTADSAKRLREPPIILAEVITASSFLDFGGLPDARYFDTLYDWRHSEAGKSSHIAPSKKDLYPGNLLPLLEKDFQRLPEERTDISRSGACQQDAIQICKMSPFHFARRHAV